MNELRTAFLEAEVERLREDKRRLERRVEELEYDLHAMIRKYEDEIGPDPYERTEAYE